MDNQRLYNQATLLALITIFYNILEGLVSVWFGLADETIALLGFGADSFVEVISGIGIWHMVRRLRASSCQTEHDIFEQRALRITGTAFYLLSVGLVITAAANIYQGHRPVTTLWGVVISLISIASMWILIHAKQKVGRALQSEAILADAACTKVCLQLSIILLVSSAGYYLTGIGIFDSLGSILIAGLSAKEGREAFGKASGKGCCCGAKISRP
ncbi:MAG TPA: cation transporter [Desulfuromonadaceae bacterium]|jgi:divalent metal cation (Fe/Co/Zn/Cd) transporter